jgi:hypothetical protein
VYPRRGRSTTAWTGLACDRDLAKGQGNYESLSDTRADVFFLFKVKCPLVAAHAGLPRDAHVLLRTPATRRDG